MVVSFIYIILWLILVVGFSGIMVFYIQAEIKCASLGTITNNSDCFAYVDSSENDTSTIQILVFLIKAVHVDFFYGSSLRYGV